jgi:large subunit ribosomal protein L6
MWPRCAAASSTSNWGSPIWWRSRRSEGITITCPKNVQIVIEGIDRQLVGEVAATIRGLRPPEPYKGKGIRYKGEYVEKKAGKSGKK